MVQKLARLLTSTALLVTACGPTPVKLVNSANSDGRSSVAHVNLRLIAARQARAEFEASTTDVSDPSRNLLVQRDTQNSLAEKCGYVPPPNAPLAPLGALLLPVLNWAIQQAVSWFIETADNRLQEMVHQYVKTWDPVRLDRSTDDLYGVLANGRPGGMSLDKPAVACLHYSRYVASDQDPKIPTLSADLVASILFDPSRPEMIQLRPLRLYYRNFSAVTPPTASQGGKPPEKKVTFAVSAQGVSIGPHSGELSSGVIAGTLLTMQFQQPASSDSPLYQLYSDNAPIIEAPLPPWDVTARGGAPQHGRLLLDITVTEAGNVPQLLQALANIVHNNKSDIEKQVTADVQKYANSIINPGSTSTPASSSSGQ